MSSIRRKPSGQWEARYRDPNGRQRGRSFSTKVEARRFLERVGADIQRGAWMDPQQGRISLDVYADFWISQRSDLSPRTLELYRDLLDRYIVPAFRGTELTRITPAAVRVWYNELAGKRKSTSAKAYRLLRAILNTAVTDERITRNPCRVEGAGVERAAERPTATIAEVDALTQAMPERLMALVLLAAWCGLRRGELLGLRRKDVDLKHGTVRVETTRQQLRDGTVVVGPPKSQAGLRTVAVPPHITLALVKHLDCYVSPEPDALLFTGIKGGPLRVHVLQKSWDQARRSIGRSDLHLHDLRHSGNTWAAATGASTRELMARMGHASPRAALIYQHATEDRDRAIAAALSSLVESAEVVHIRRNCPPSDQQK
ncbi:tyrosine-type recombinase/integrase [Ferrimicrobium acidiphilum]|uniref:tyrosine-type recombinase/integrase n=1 Tax=Ferrimicrobium acidiphilum TaxID=121039 RepID=UPI0023F26CB1|nr:tyrosine-type recombinase/integrase [Ferrimicrobium acidiphilum]